jgi:hypothetical protein
VLHVDSKLDADWDMHRTWIVYDKHLVL